MPLDKHFEINVNNTQMNVTLIKSLKTFKKISRLNSKRIINKTDKYGGIT